MGSEGLSMFKAQDQGGVGLAFALGELPLRMT